MSEVTHDTKNQRRCVTCSKSTSKQALYRIVRNASGKATFDKTGRAPGRGAYVCSMECFKTARKTKRLDRALKTSLACDDYERIEMDISALIRQM